MPRFGLDLSLLSSLWKTQFSYLLYFLLWIIKTFRVIHEIVEILFLIFWDSGSNMRCQLFFQKLSHLLCGFQKRYMLNQKRAQVKIKDFHLSIIHSLLHFSFFFFWLQYIRMKVSQKCFAPDIEKENVEPESQGHSPLTVTNWMPNPCLS